MGRIKVDKNIPVEVDEDSVELVDKEVQIPDEDAIASPLCGNGIVEGDEECDGGPAECPYNEKCQVCTDQCTLVAGNVPYCGDGILQTEHEQCEVGNIKDCTAINAELYAGGVAACKEDCSGHLETACIVAGWSVITVGGLHSCGVWSGVLYCWGSNFAMQLGDGSNIDRK